MEKTGLLVAISIVGLVGFVGSAKTSITYGNIYRDICAECDRYQYAGTRRDLTWKYCSYPRWVAAKKKNFLKT